MRLFTVIFLMFIYKASLFAQQKAGIKYVYDGNTVASTELILKPDLTFKYYHSYDQAFDLGCGTYRVAKDTIFLTYKYNEKDTCCNTEKQEVIWSEDDLVSQRPDTLILKDKKLYSVEDNKVIYKSRFRLRTDASKIRRQDNYFLIEEKYAQKATWY